MSTNQKSVTWTISWQTGGHPEEPSWPPEAKALAGVGERIATAWCRTVTLQLHGVQLALLRHDGEYFLLDGCRSQLRRRRKQSRLFADDTAFPAAMETHKTLPLVPGSCWACWDWRCTCQRWSYWRQRPAVSPRSDGSSRFPPQTPPRRIWTAPPPASPEHTRERQELWRIEAARKHLDLRVFNIWGGRVPLPRTQIFSILISTSWVLTGQSPHFPGCSLSNSPLRSKVEVGVLTTMVPSFPWFRWNCSRSWKGKSQMTSELRTKNGSSSMFSSSRANASGPAERARTEPKVSFLLETFGPFT